MSSKSKSKSKPKPTIKLKTKSAAEKREAKEDLDAKKLLGFTDSTQFNHWLFPSPSIINNKRLTSLNNEITKLKLYSSDFSTKYSIPTNDEYFASLSYYSKEIIEICRKFEFPHYVSCTAVSYFKRLFLNNKYNLINIDGMCMKDTAIYLASKTEQCLFENINQLTSVTKIPSSQVVNNELILMDGINFELKIWNPFRPFRSFLNDFKLIYKKKQKNILNEIYSKQILKQGYNLIQDSFISDVCLIYTPSQIALSCLLLSISNINVNIYNNNKEKERVKNDIKGIKNMSVYYFNFRFKDNKQFDELKCTTQVIQNMIIDGIQKTNHKNYVELQKNANIKLYKLQTLYYKIKSGKINKINNNKNKNVNVKVNGNGNINMNVNRNVNGNVNGNVNRNVNRNVNGNIKKEKKKKFNLKLKLKSKKRKGNNNGIINGGPVVKKQKLKR